MTDRQERLARIAEGWDEAAAGYERYYVPRFAPWVDAAVRAAVSVPLPDGPVLVPCCGTFPELDALIRHLPDRRIIGIDLSTEMVRLARERASGHPQVSVVEGDASTLAPQWSGQCAAVVSVFGLQQLPEPAAALRSWTGALRNDGRLSVVYWPSTTETDGPFALIARLVREVVPSDHDPSWEDELVPTLTAHGATIEQTWAASSTPGSPIRTATRGSCSTCPGAADPQTSDYAVRQSASASSRSPQGWKPILQA